MANESVQECVGCKYWKELAPESALGLCRRFPPIILQDFKYLEREDMSDPLEAIGDLTYFPTTGCENWCGEWKEASK